MPSSKRKLARQAWLLYFNRVLLERKVITEQEYRRMLPGILGSGAKEE